MSRLYDGHGEIRYILPVLVRLEPFLTLPYHGVEEENILFLLCFIKKEKKIVMLEHV